MKRNFSRRATRLLCIGALSAAGFATPFVPVMVAPALAQPAPVSNEARLALEPYGRWVQHPRFGEVWVPDVPDGWRPYTLGHWVYTEEWGWYWISDEEWGWVPYHYGRWFFDRDVGWTWIPGQEWGPAWVDWRRGERYAGWSPLPPDEIIEEEYARPELRPPEVWVFVPLGGLLAPRITEVIVPQREAAVYYRETVIVNRTVVIQEGGPHIAVNPGIQPAYIAAAIGHPIRVVTVQPPVLTGTVGVQGAVLVRPEQLRGGARGGTAGAPRIPVTVHEGQTQIAPSASVPPPRPLQRNEAGRLGATPPAAARGATAVGIGKTTQQAEPRGAPPTAEPGGKQQPPAVAPRPQPPATEPRREPAPATEPRREPAPATEPRREPAPATEPRREPAPATEPRREPAPATEPRREPAPATEPRREPAPATEPRREPAPATEPRREPAPATEPRREPAPATEPRREPPPAAEPRRQPPPATEPRREPPPATEPRREPPPATEPRRQPPPATEPRREPPPAAEPRREPPPATEPRREPPPAAEPRREPPPAATPPRPPAAAPARPAPAPARPAPAPRKPGEPEEKK